MQRRRLDVAKGRGEDEPSSGALLVGDDDLERDVLARGEENLENEVRLLESDCARDAGFGEGFGQVQWQISRSGAGPGGCEKSRGAEEREKCGNAGWRSRPRLSSAGSCIFSPGGPVTWWTYPLTPFSYMRLTHLPPSIFHPSVGSLPCWSNISHGGEAGSAERKC